ncbi:CatB-related O-acetyltransferase [Puteibacter caeruleilacunae]|nr:CatB-related O-acetyltransferase [Puteibacter caeruleilacunae]
MGKLSYVLGLIRYILNLKISKLAFIDYRSNINKRARICHQVKVFSSNVSAYTYIGPRSKVVNASIGKFVSIASDCSIGLASHSHYFMSTSPIFTARKNSTKHRWVENDSYDPVQKVNIGNDVWIGTKAIIMGGVEIGNGAIIGAGAIVTKDVPDYAIVVGIPGRIVRYRFRDDIIKELCDLKWWNLEEKCLKRNLKLFAEEVNLENIREFKNIIK